MYGTDGHFRLTLNNSISDGSLGPQCSDIHQFCNFASAATTTGITFVALAASSGAQA